MRRYQVSVVRGPVWSAPLGPLRARRELRRALAEAEVAHPLRTAHELLTGLRFAAHLTTRRVEGVRVRVLVGTVPPFPWVPPAALLTRPTRRIRRIWREVWLVFGDAIRSLGVYAPRTVAGTTCWSEHAWAAAWDIGGSTQVLDRVNRYLRRNGRRLGVHRTIWQDRQYIGPSYRAESYSGVDHSTHIHVETASHGCRRPPWI